MATAKPTPGRVVLFHDVNPHTNAREIRPAVIVRVHDDALPDGTPLVDLAVLPATDHRVPLHPNEKTAADAIADEERTAAPYDETVTAAFWPARSSSTS